MGHGARTVKDEPFFGIDHGEAGSALPGAKPASAPRA